MAKTYIKELKEKVGALEDGFDMYQVELGLLENEIQEINMPNQLLGEQTGLLLEMLSEVVEFGKKKPSERVTASKKRLLELLSINTRLNQIVSYNQSLKVFNKQLVGSIQVLRLENSKLNKQIENMVKAEEY